MKIILKYTYFKIFAFLQKNKNKNKNRNESWAFSKSIELITNLMILCPKDTNHFRRLDSTPTN